MTNSVVDAVDYRALFEPRSIALVGATDKSPWSLNTFNNIKDSGYDGNVYLVNPKSEVVHGENTYADIRSLPEVVDLIFVMVPTKVVLSTLKEAVASGVPSAVILTAGFSETGAEGQRLEQEIIDYASRSGLTVLGPNGNGFINAAAGITPYGLPIGRPLLEGSVGFVLQSGALASSVLQFAQSRNVGISFLTAMGNETMMSVTDVMDYLIEDPNTSVIALFLESVRDPAEFRRIARRALAVGKPIVALKIGRSALGAQAALAHTGSLVGDNSVITAAFEQLGVIRVVSLEDLITTAGLLASVGSLPGRRVGVVTPSGGASEIIADRAEDVGLVLTPFAPETVAQLEEIVPDFATVQNPLDVTGYVVIDRTLMRRSLDVVTRDPGIDFAILLSEVPRVEPADHAIAVAAYQDSATVIRATAVPTVVVSTVLTDVTAYGRRLQEEAGFPHVVGGIEHGMTALGHVVAWSEAYRTAQTESLPADETVTGIELPADAEGMWTEYRAGQFLADQGIAVIPSQLADTADDAIRHAEEIGYPVVLKAVAAGLGHKSDIGGVRLNLHHADDVRAAHNAIVEALQATGAEGCSTLVQPQRSADGIEMLVGVVRDPVWGLTLAVGLGGIWVEVLQDTAVRVLPVTATDVKEAIGTLRGISLLHGARGSQPVDLDAVAREVALVADVAFRLGDRLEALEINPLRVQGPNVEALDALITWTETSEHGKDIA